MGESGAGTWAAASGSVSASGLRDTLDRIRAGLDRPITVLGGSAALVYDKRAIAQSLRELLAKLQASDLKSPSPFLGFVAEYRPKQQVEQLRGLVESLQHALRKRVTDFLGERKIRLAMRLLSSPTPDVLRILGREHDENSHSDLIAWLLNPARAPVVAPPALHGLVEKLALPVEQLASPAEKLVSPAEWVAKIDRNVAKQLISVRREMVIAREFADEDDLRRIDIVISGPDFVLAIENKVWSQEHTDQTSAYWEWLEPMTCLHGGIFLSPGGADPSCSDFKAVSYFELISLLLTGPAETDLTPGGEEEIVLASYLKTLARHILRVEMRAVREAALAMEAK